MRAALLSKSLKSPGIRASANPAKTAVFALLFSVNSPQLKAEDCTGNLAPNDLKRCEDTFARKVQTGSRTADLPGGWRLVRTPDPRGGPDAVSILHTADTLRSDANFAGLTFRCSRSGIEALLVVIPPLDRGSHYAIRINSGANETQFEAKALQAGEVLLLPQNATALAAGPWQAAPQLSVDIATPSPIHGSVPTGGLSGALAILSQSCPAH
jgi:hypothetical protein